MENKGDGKISLISISHRSSFQSHCWATLTTWRKYSKSSLPSYRYFPISVIVIRCLSHLINAQIIVIKINEKLSDCPLPDTERTVPATSSLCYHNESMMLGRSYILFPPFCTIQIHSMIKTYHCVFRMALRQQFIGFSDAIAPVKSEELIWLKQPETYWMMFSCRNCFVLFIIVCLCIFSLKLQRKII